MGDAIVRVKVRADRAVRGMTKHLPRWPIPTADVPVVACSVYRADNRHHVERTLLQLPPHADVRLHALDETAPTLATRTVSTGPGQRTSLLQGLVDARSIPTDAWIVFFDDDVEFALPGRTAFLDVAVAAQFDVAGAAIDVRQHRTYLHSLVGRASVARTVGMVEIGPVVAFSPAASDKLLPLPDDFGMGWGLDVRWSQVPSLRRGYVDATPVRHYGAVGASYDSTDELERFRQELARAGLASQREVARTLEVWRCWRPRPPWLMT